MGDRWNIHNDEIEARRYREKTPLARRVLDAALQYGLAIGVPLLLLTALIYGHER